MLKPIASLCVGFAIVSTTIHAQEVVNYRLTIERVRQYDSAVRKLYQVPPKDRDPFFRADIMIPSPFRTTTAFIQHVETSPELATLIKSSGLTPVEFWILPQTLTSADAAYNMETRGQHAVLNATSENKAFIKLNQAEIRKLISGWLVRD